MTDFGKKNLEKIEIFFKKNFFKSCLFDAKTSAKKNFFLKKIPPKNFGPNFGPVFGSAAVENSKKK